jgi:hypothetical protein
VSRDKELTTFEDGVYKRGDLSTVDESIRNDVATQLGIQQGENETEDAFLARLQAAYDSYISLLNNGEDIQIIAEKQAAVAEAAKYTASENEARGGPAESIIYSAQNEATEAGLDANEMMQYADALRQVHAELDEVTAAQVALGNAKMNAGLREIIDSYDEWSTILDEDTGALKDTSAEGVAAYNKLKASVNKMLNTSEDLSDAFWDNADNMKNIKKAAEGDVKALGKLQKAATQDYLVNLALEPNFDEDARNAILTLSDFIMDTDLPDLEAGVELTGQEDFITRCNDLIKVSGMTAEQVSNAFKSMGYDVEFDPNPQTVTQVQAVPVTTYSVSGSMEDGSFKMVPTVEIKEIPYESSVAAPTIKTLTSTGSGGGGISTSNASAAKGNKGGGGGSGGGGGDKKKKEKWENPYDEFYNLTQKVNEALRQREKIERNYDRLLKNRNSTSKQILANSLQEIGNLQKEIALQKQLQAGRKKQISKLGSETFKDDEGKEKTFSQWGVTKYASYNEKTGTIKIDWAAIDKVKDPEKGAAIEAYISKLEELSEQFEETQDTIEDMEDLIREIQERGKAEYVDFEQRIYDALVARDQKIIDNLSEINDSINDSNSRLLDSIQSAVDEQRKARERDEQRDDIEEKQRRLALLKSDTSGANALEIKALEEEIKDLQESYTDSLVDDSLAQLQQQNEDAAEQRERQIEIMQNQLDYAAENGAYWKEVSNLLNTAFNPNGSLNNNSALVNLLKETEGFKALSEFGGMQWIDELIESWLVAQEGLANWKIEKAKQSTEGVKTQNAGTLKYNSATGLWKDAKGGTYSTLTYDPTTRQYTASGYTPQTSAPAPTPSPAPTSGSGKLASVPSKLYSKLSKNEVKSLQSGLNDLLAAGHLSGFSKLAVDGIYGPKTMAAVKKLQAKIGTTVDGKWGKKTASAFKNSSLRAYKKGGLVDFTGPAWMDGTKADPELVLKSEDTKNFIALKEILSDILSMDRIPSQNNRDNYFEIHIEVDKLANDYDVEQVAEKVKRIINEDARYRNVNAINLLR